MDTKLLEIGHRLCAQRKKKGLTQDALAEKANVDFLLFGNTPPVDFSALNSKISQLSPEQHRCLEDIINSFLTAVAPGEK